MIITNIKEFREQNKMSQTELAQLVGVRRETIGHLEVYDNLGKKWLGIYNDLYLQFKMYRK